jgi:hypothetical protein
MLANHLPYKGTIGAMFTLYGTWLVLYRCFLLYIGGSVQIKQESQGGRGHGGTLRYRICTNTQKVKTGV